MNGLMLKYGCNPNQEAARVFMDDGSALPIEVLNGRPGFINLLDALNAWQLVTELEIATGMPAAASFKHVSPAGAAVGLPLTDILKKIYFVEDYELTPMAAAYARARGADRMCSFGDFIALSGTCDSATAKLIGMEVSDGIIAPNYEPEALEILKKKRKGGYTIIKIDKHYVPAELERKHVFGITFEQNRNDAIISESLLKNIVTKNKNMTENAARDLLIALITIKYTQSNSVCYVKDGQTIGVGAGQQSRIHCTRLAGDKADVWHLRQHPKVLGLEFREDLGRPNRDNAIDVYISRDYEDVIGEGVWQDIFAVRPEPLTENEKKEFLSQITGVALGSDAFLPFGDNIDRAEKSGVKYIAQSGGSIRDDHVIAACDSYNMVMVFTGLRLFHH